MWLWGGGCQRAGVWGHGLFFVCTLVLPAERAPWIQGGARRCGCLASGDCFVFVVPCRVVPLWERGGPPPHRGYRPRGCGAAVGLLPGPTPPPCPHQPGGCAGGKCSSSAPAAALATMSPHTLRTFRPPSHTPRPRTPSCHEQAPLRLAINQPAAQPLALPATFHGPPPSTPPPPPLPPPPLPPPPCASRAEGGWVGGEGQPVHTCRGCPRRRPPRGVPGRSRRADRQAATEAGIAAKEPG